MNLYGLEVKVMETAEQFSFTPRLNDDDYPLSNIKKAIIRLTQPSGNYKELTINNPTESILLSYQDFYEITEGTYILTLRVTDTSDNLIIFPNLNSIVADVTDSSISIEGNVLSAAMVNDIYNKMKSEVIQGAKGDAATVSVGTVDTLNPDEEATVTNSGNSNNAVFNFGIPKGDKGDTGEQGKQGPQGHVGLTPLTFVGYADDNSGNGFNTNPQSSSKYIGVYQTSMYSLVTGKAFNQYVNASDGTFSDSSNDIRTDYIEVKPNTEYTVNFNPYATGVEIEHSNLVYYDENKQYISKEPTIETNVVSLNNGSSTTITTPENCKYVVISTHCDQTNSINSTIQLAEGHVDINSEDSSRYKWSLMQGPQGEKGDTGATGPKGDNGVTPTVSIGNVTTLSSSAKATVSSTNSGANVVLDFGIPQGEKGDTGDIGDYCVSTGWIQTGLSFPSNALNPSGYYSITTINGASVLEFYVQAAFKLTDINAWGKEIFALPTNVTAKSDIYLFFPFYSNYGFGNLKYRNGQVIMNQFNNIGNADSSGNVQIITNGRIPVTLNN